MILIFEYQWGSEPCSGTEIFPVEYKSKDDLILDFQIACEDSFRNKSPFNFFINQELDLSNFVMYNSLTKEYCYYGPSIFTLEEWLQQETRYRINNA
jgi:hypothetical protein